MKKEQLSLFPPLVPAAGNDSTSQVLIEPDGESVIKFASANLEELNIDVVVVYSFSIFHL